MYDSLIQWTAAFGMTAVAVMFALELRRWRSLASVIGRRQRILRVALILLVEALFVMMYFGPRFTQSSDPLTALIYWTVCVLLGMGVVILALVDLREVFKSYAAVNRRVFRELRGDDRRDQ